MNASVLVLRFDLVALQAARAHLLSQVAHLEYTMLDSTAADVFMPPANQVIRHLEAAIAALEHVIRRVRNRIEDFRG